MNREQSQKIIVKTKSRRSGWPVCFFMICLLMSSPFAYGYDILKGEISYPTEQDLQHQLCFSSQVEFAKCMNGLDQLLKASEPEEGEGAQLSKLALWLNSELTSEIRAVMEVDGYRLYDNGYISIVRLPQAWINKIRVLWTKNPKLWAQNYRLRRDRWARLYRRLEGKHFNMHEILKSITAKYRTEENRNQMIIGFHSGKIGTVDPFARIVRYNADLNSVDSSTELKYGLSLTFSGGKVFVRHVEPLSFFDRQGIIRGDELFSINNSPIGRANPVTLEQLDALEMDKATLAFKDPGQLIKMVTVDESQIDHNTTNRYVLNTTETKVGVIRLSKFKPGHSCAVFKKYLEEFNNLGISKLIIDLRNSPGGNSKEKICIASLFLESGKIMSIGKKLTRGFSFDYESATEHSELSKIRSQGPMLFSGVLVLLTNSNSISAAELLAGILQDMERAWVVGQTSFGKALSQDCFLQWIGPIVYCLFKTDEIYYFSSGYSSHRVGVLPDFEVKNNFFGLNLDANDMSFDDLFDFPVPAQNGLGRRDRELKISQLKPCIKKKLKLGLGIGIEKNWLKDNQLKNAFALALCEGED